MQKNFIYWQEMPKYNFRDYWNRSRQMLSADREFLKMDLERHKRENIEISEDGMTITYKSKRAFEQIQRRIAELEYIDRVLLVRRFWAPRDWWNSIREHVQTLFEQLGEWQVHRIRKRAAKMSEEQRFALYRRQVQKK